MTERCKKSGVTGWPVAHSRSPLLQNHWLKKYDLEGEYGLYPVAPEDAEKFYRNFSATGLVGCNVTIPHKETAASACDFLDEAAQAMGAANTLWIDDAGKLHGANTDGIGFLGNLDQHAPGWDEKAQTAVVLGAGGAARAVVWSLLKRKFTSVYIFNRTLQKAQILRTQFGSATKALPWDKIVDYLEEADVLVNTTSLGMTGKPPLQLDLGSLSRHALVTDIVYSPLKTDLLAYAQARGNPIVDGLGMLLHQAVPGFEKWFGVKPEVDEELRRLVLKDLG